MSALNNFQLIISIIAIVVSLSTAIYSININRTLSSSDYRLSQQVKSDTATLVATLRSMITKGMYARLGKPMDMGFEKERINEFLNSSTGLAFYSWAAKKDLDAGEGVEEPWRLFFYHLSELTAHNIESQEVVRGAASLEALLASLKEADLESIINYNADLTKLIAGVGDSREGNAFVYLAQENGNAQNQDERTAEKMRKLKFLKDEKKVSDPTLDLLLAVYQNNLKAAEVALDNGADMHFPIDQILSKYESMLGEMEQ